MKILSLPSLVIALFSLILAAPAAEASPKLQPGAYALRVQIQTGEIAGTVLRGTCVVTPKRLTYSLRLPRGARPATTSGVASHNGRAAFTAKSNVGKIRISVTRATRKNAAGRFTARDASGTWTLTRK